MKIAATIARYLLGLMFFVFGMNGFFNFLPPPPPLGGLAGKFIEALVGSHYFLFVAGTQVLGGALLLVNRYVTFALVILGPVIANILIYHISMDPKGIVPGLVVTTLWGFLAFRARRHLAGIFAPRLD